MYYFFNEKAVMTIESADRNLESFPFPSITICNQNKISKSKLADLLRKPIYTKFNTEQIKILVAVMLQVSKARNRSPEITDISQILESCQMKTNEVLDIINQV
jgi:hypothetical protein